MSDEVAGVIHALGFLAEVSVAAEIVYGEGAVMAVILVVFAFLFVAYTDGYWFVGAGLVTALISALLIFTGWHLLADYPLVYRAGDRPDSSRSGASLYENWDLDSGAIVSTTFEVEDASDAESLAGSLHLEYGCPAARVDWRVYAADDLLASGTFGEGDERELKEVAVRSGELPTVVKVTAARTDTDDCKTVFYWRNPGFEGPGNGKFRFVFPVPEE